MGDFFYGEQANIFSFYRFPKALFTDSRFQGISRWRPRSSMVFCWTGWDSR